MNLPMDKPLCKVIELKPRASDMRPMVEIKSRDFSKAQCEHVNFSVDKENRTVECGRCGQQLDAMHVLILIATSEHRRRRMKESLENHARKENEKTLKAAVISLRKRNITPERFAILYEKYKNEEPEKGLY